MGQRAEKQQGKSGVESPRPAPAAPGRTSRGPSSAYTTRAVCLLLVLAVALVFGQTVRYDFVNYDDDLLVYENPVVMRGFTAQGVYWAFTTSVAHMWYPLTWISYMADSQIFGTKPWGYHLTNVLLHAATSVILFVALRRMTGNLWASALVAALFAIHPLRAEAVAWVGERKSPLSGLFFASTLAAYFEFTRRPLSLARYLAVVGLFSLGLLAKPTLVTLPFLLLLLDYWPLGRWRLESALLLVLEKVPLLVLSVACCVAAVVSQTGNIAPLNAVPIPARIANALVSCTVYLGQFFWPVGLAAFYPRPETYPAWQVAGSVLVLAAVSLAALAAWRKQPAMLVGWLWYLGMLLPTSGLVQIGAHARADRYTYLPQIGQYILMVWGAHWFVEQLWGDWRWRARLYGGGGALLVAGLMVCTWQQTLNWQNSERLWTHALACTSNNSIAHCNLGLVLAERGRVEEAIAQYRMVLQVEPDDIETHNNLGLALAGRGEFEEAIAHYLRALQLKPDFALAHNNLGIALAGRGQVEGAMAEFRKAMEIKPDLASAHYNLGLALADRGQVEEAIAQFRKALACGDDFVGTHFHLGKALASRGQVEEAIAHYRRVLEIQPDFVAAHINLGVVLSGRGQVEEAIAHYRKVLEIEPDYAEAHNNLGLILSKRGEFDAAIAHFRQALKTKPDFLEAHYNLGIALAGEGRLDEALEHYRQALALATARNNKPLADMIRTRIRRSQQR